MSARGMKDMTLRESLSSASIARITEFLGYELGVTVWAFSGLAFVDKPLRQAISSASIAPISAALPRDSQSLSRTAWAFSELLGHDPPLRSSISSSARRRLTHWDFETQDSANSAWSLSVCAVALMPLLSALSSASRNTLSECMPWGLANMAWSVAELVLSHDPLRAAISAQALRKSRATREAPSTRISLLLGVVWAAWRASSPFIAPDCTGYY